MIKNQLFIFFDAPDYGGIPTEVASELSSEAVDTLQDMWSEIICLNIEYNPSYGFTSIQQFKKEYRQALRSLGEKII